MSSVYSEASKCPYGRSSGVDEGLPLTPHPTPVLLDRKTTRGGDGQEKPNTLLLNFEAIQVISALLSLFCSLWTLLSFHMCAPFEKSGEEEL